jgi:hypothetical protein
MPKSNLDKLCEEKGIKIVAVYTGLEREGDDRPMHHYRVTLTYRDRELHVDFRTGTGIEAPARPGVAHRGVGPSAADVISCLCSDAQTAEDCTDFANFCSEFGYEFKSAAEIRAAERAYRGCVEIAPKIRALLGADFNAFANAEH